MAYLIDRIQASLQKDGLIPRTQKSRNWLKTKIMDLRPTKQSLMNDMHRLRESTIIGKMYFYFYDPKTKKTMPYYDRFPLVLPIEQYPDGFLGLNLHYIHPKQRIILLDKLSEYATDSRFDKQTKEFISGIERDEQSERIETVDAMINDIKGQKNQTVLNKHKFIGEIKSGLGKKINAKRKKNLYAVEKNRSYNRVPQPVDQAGEETHNNSLDSLFNKLGESDNKKSKLINEEMDKMKHLLGYKKKTQ